MMGKDLFYNQRLQWCGKTTASLTVLPEVLQCREFVNADDIAKGLSPDNPESVAIEAGRIMLKRIEKLLSRGETFSIETTLATRSYINLARRAKALGYRVSVLFFWLRTPRLAIERVAERVLEGGHNIPDDVIKRRYASGINNLFKLFIPVVDFWDIYDNSVNPRKHIAYGGQGAKTVVFEERLLNQMLRYVR